MRALTIEDLNAAAHVGGASSLVMRQELEPASGPDGVIAPAKYVDSNGNATYIIEKRYMEGEENPKSGSDRFQDFLREPGRGNDYGSHAEW